MTQRPVTASPLADSAAAPPTSALQASQAKQTAHSSSQASGTMQPDGEAAHPSHPSHPSMDPSGGLADTGQVLQSPGLWALPMRALTAAFPALTHRDYRLMWMGAMCSNMGTWMQTVALQWLIKTQAPDSSALWLGRAAFCQQIPTAVLIPIGGMLADRLDRRWIILTGNICLAILALTLMLLHWQGRTNLWLLLGAVTVIGIWNAMLRPSNQSLLSTLIPKDSLPNAVALNSVQFNLTRAIGPALGGMVLVALSATWSFGINALAYATIIAAVLMIRLPPEPHTSKPAREGPLASLAGGLTYLKFRRDLQLMLAIVFSSSFLAAPLLFMLPAIVESMYDDDPRQYARLLSCFGIGAVVGVTLLAMRSRKPSSPWRGFITMALFAMTQVAISLGWRFEVVMGLMACGGAAYISSLNRFFAGTIGSIPSQMRGRVSSLHMLSMLIGYPLGSLLAGSLASVYGIAMILRIYGLSLLGVLLLAGLVVWKCSLRFQDDTDGSITQRPEPEG